MRRATGAKAGIGILQMIMYRQKSADSAAVAVAVIADQRAEA
eukprot:SAG11_NODE_27059_length_337_cov_1.092437_2_plen_41_part_01